MAGAKRLGTGHGDAGDVIQGGHLVTRKPQPGRGAIAGCTVIHGLIQPAADGARYFRLQTRGGKFIAADEEVLTEFSAIGLKGNDAARKVRQFLFHLLLQASQTERHFGTRGAPAVGSLATQIESVGDKCGHPCALILEVLAFGRHAREACPPIAGAPAKTNFGIGLLETHAFRDSNRLQAGV